MTGALNLSKARYDVHIKGQAKQLQNFSHGLSEEEESKVWEITGYFTSLCKT